MSDRGLGHMVLMVTFVPLILLSFVYGANVILETDYQTAINVKDTKTFTVDDNWTEKGTLSTDMLTDSDLIYAQSNSQGSWTSFAQEYQRNRVLNLSYDADMRDGTGFIEVRAWKNNLSGSPDATERINLTTGTIEEKIGFSQYDVFVAYVNMTENDDSKNKRPSMDSLSLTFEIVEDQKNGLSNNIILVLFSLMIFLTTMSLMLGVVYYLDE